MYEPCFFKIYIYTPVIYKMVRPCLSVQAQDITQTANCNQRESKSQPLDLRSWLLAIIKGYYKAKQSPRNGSVVLMFGVGSSLTLPFCPNQTSFLLHSTPSTLSPSGMLGKSLASSLLTFDSATSCFCVPDVATSAPNIVTFSVTLSSTLPQTVIRRVGSSHFSPHKWAINVNTEGKTWEACRQALSAFGFSNEEEDKILGKAFGHVHSPYWGEERKKEEPRFEIVNEILEYLRSLGLSDDDLRKLLKKFPEVLGCDIKHELRTNVQILEKDWGIKGKSLKNLLLRNPKVLGYNVDCKGDCMAQCTRCWVRF